jgi:hypothetical protein
MKQNQDKKRFIRRLGQSSKTHESRFRLQTQVAPVTFHCSIVPGNNAV